MTGILEPNQDKIELQKLQNELQILRPLGEMKLTPELSKLRTDTLDVWADCEETFEKIITKKLWKTAVGNRKSQSFEEFRKLTNKLFFNTTWARKLEMVYQLNLIEDSLYDELKNLNKTRITFAHSMNKHYLLFEDTTRQIWTYKLLNFCLIELAKIDVSFHF